MAFGPPPEVDGLLADVAARHAAWQLVRDEAGKLRGTAGDQLDDSYLEDLRPLHEKAYKKAGRHMKLLRELREALRSTKDPVELKALEEQFQATLQPTDPDRIFPKVSALEAIDGKSAHDIEQDPVLGLDTQAQDAFFEKLFEELFEESSEVLSEELSEGPKDTTGSEHDYANDPRLNLPPTNIPRHLHARCWSPMFVMRRMSQSPVIGPYGFLNCDIPRGAPEYDTLERVGYPTVITYRHHYFELRCSECNGNCVLPVGGTEGRDEVWFDGIEGVQDHLLHIHNISVGERQIVERCAVHQFNQAQIRMLKMREFGAPAITMVRCQRAPDHSG